MHDASVIYVDLDTPEYIRWNQAITSCIVYYRGTHTQGFDYFLYLDEFEDIGHLEIHITNTHRFTLFCMRFGLCV